MVGNFFNNARDQATICRALPRLIETNRKIHFVFIGGWLPKNKCYQECQSICQARRLGWSVHFWGLERRVWPIIRYLDIFVYSTNYDSCPLSVIEAMHAGLPIIATDISQMRELLGSNGAIFFKPHSHKDLNRKINLLLSNHSRRALLGRAAQKRARANYSIKIYIRNLESVYRNILNTPR